VSAELEIPNTSVEDVSTVIAFHGGAMNRGSGDIDVVLGIRAAGASVGGANVGSGVSGGLLEANLEDGGTAGWVLGLESGTTVVDSTVTDIWGVYTASSITGTSSVTNRYGVYIEVPVGSTAGDDFALYAAGPQPS
jgi:hypothetical protein